jgi:hypothetical protein
VIEIQQCAFTSCDSLAPLDLADGLHSIGPESFSACKLQAWRSRWCVSAMHGAEVCISIRNVVDIEDRMFDECISRTHVEIPPTVTEIGVAAFQHCKGLKRLRIPSLLLVGESHYRCVCTQDPLLTRTTWSDDTQQSTLSNACT